MINLLYLLIAFLLILLNGFFVAAEFAMVRIRQTQIEYITKHGSLSGKILIKIHKHLDVYLSACQVGVTLASLGLGWVGEPAFAHLFSPLLIKVGVQPLEIKIFSFALAFIAISFLHIVIGELVPKSMAIRQPERLSLWTAFPLYVFYWLTYPAIFVLNMGSNLLLSLFRLNVQQAHSFYSTQEIKMVLNSSYLHGEITKDEADIMEHTLEFADLRITEVMRPADELVTLDVNTPIKEAVEIAVATRFSRYPVTKHNKIIGFVHVKDLLVANNTNDSDFSLIKLLRPTYNVQFRIPAIDLLRNFRNTGNHFSLIYRRNRLIGFVTLDNLLHIILGRIKDEFHKTSNDWVRNHDGSITLSGDCSIYSLEQALECEIEDNEKYSIDNISQLIIYRLGSIPKLNQLTSLNEFEFKITKMIEKVVHEIIVYPKDNVN